MEYLFTFIKTMGVISLVTIAGYAIIRHINKKYGEDEWD